MNQCVKELTAEFVVEGFDEGSAGGLSWPRELYCHRNGKAPEIDDAENELAALVNGPAAAKPMLNAKTRHGRDHADCGGCPHQGRAYKVLILLSKMASRKGFEPLTPGLGNLCSILLSYRDFQIN
jgi:hypothetical protein